MHFAPKLKPRLLKDLILTFPHSQRTLLEYFNDLHLFVTCRPLQLKQRIQHQLRGLVILDALCHRSLVWLFILEE